MPDRTLPPPGFRLEFADEFTGPSLDEGKWIPYYLPHWSSRSQGSARYSFADGGLVLRIDADQPPWCAEFDGTNRTSTLQTGEYAGPLGSPTGQSRFRPDLVVREVQESRLLYGMHHGYVEIRAKATADPEAMVALWMIGYEDEPQKSAEICVCEIFGNEVAPSSAAVGMGVHPFGDPALTDEFEKVRVDVDVTDYHVYAADWRPGSVDFYIDDQQVKSVQQAPDYPLQLMLGIFAFPSDNPGPYPKEFPVDYVRIYSA
jgi:Glycosyl hydrolases family 16